MPAGPPSSSLLDGDGPLGAAGRTSTGLLLEPRRYLGLGDGAVAVIIERVHLGTENVAPRVPSAQLLVDAYLHRPPLDSFVPIAGGTVPRGPRPARSRREVYTPRGIWLHGTSRSVRGSPGRPSTRSPKMLRITSEVPPAMVAACTWSSCPTASPIRSPTPEAAS